MRLIAVEIANYRVIRHAAIQLPDSLIGIIGPNGAGKSSLVEAISWALYGQQAARSARSEVKSTFASPAESCEVQLVFEVRGEEHRVVRRLVGAGQRLEVELFRGGTLEVVGSMETQQYIERLLGLDWRGYVTSVFARQSDLDAFSGLQPAKRREHLAAMLGIDRLDRAMDRAKTDARIDLERMVLLEKQAAPFGELEATLVRLRERLAQAKAVLQVTSGAREAATRQLREIEVRYTEHEGRSASCSQIETQLEIVRTERGHLSERLEQLTTEEESLKQLRLKTEERRPLLGNLEPLRAEIRKMEKSKESVAARTRIAQELESAQHEWLAVEDTIKKLAVRLADIRSSIAATPILSRQDIEAARSELERERELYQQVSEQKKQADQEAQKIRNNLAQIASLGGEAVCSRCLRPYGTDLEQISRHLKEELRQAEAVAGKLEGKQRQTAQSGAALKEKVRSLETTLEQTRTLQQALELAESERRQTESRRTILADRTASLKRQMVDTGEVAYDETRWEEMSARLIELETADRSIADADGQLKRLPVVEESLKKLTNEVLTAGARIEELEKRRASIAFDPRSFIDSKTELQRAVTAAQTAHDRHIEAVHVKELLTREVTSTEQRLTALRELIDDLKTVRDRRSRTDRLVRLFGDLRRSLVAGIRPRLAEIGSQLLDDMTAGRYTSMELDEDYTISIYDNGQAFGIERFSGGESDLANLCLRLAVSLALAESAGLERSLVILDEVFGSQDENRRELIYQGLAALKPRFPQIIAITHIEELKNRVETLIEIVPTGGGWSEVRVDGIVA